MVRRLNCSGEEDYPLPRTILCCCPPNENQSPRKGRLQVWGPLVAVLLHACHRLHAETVLVTGFAYVDGYGELSFVRISMAAAHLELIGIAAKHPGHGTF